MTIENLVRLINGQTLNKPSVSSVLGFAFEAKNVKRGFAFMAVDADQKEIELAVKHGAYAVISDEEITPSDTEIAYIKVDNFQTALIRLMRFEATHKNLKFCSVNAVQMAILEHSSLGKNAAIIPKNLTELFYKIMSSKNGDIFFGDEIRILQRITPLYDTVWTDIKAQALNPSSIFFTTMICDDVYYQNLNIPRVFIGALCGLLHYLKQNNISFKLNDTRSLGHFEPIFIDKNFHQAPFGSSFRAIIIENDEELFAIEALYLKKNFDPSEVVICLPKDSLLQVDNAVRFENLYEIKELKNFRYMLVLSQKSEILNLLSESEIQDSLF
ncbi:ferrochelatase [Campylobacter sp. RM13119]|uniref:ferrochelatase n=1 Tax=Campylobacter californiensis TaxID=1032243 RepID=UPI0014755561|nr:ferrochelatase [Campylobacter sp. RM13119]MBE3605724.1 ferrochelatase [Campylobacter sp. RM13119]